MIRRTAWFVGAIVIMANVGGCGIGYNRVLFGTKTNVGFDVDAKPPVVQLNIARTEGVIAPQFENGKKLPVMASFRFQNSESFSPTIGSAFATGDAALTLAALYNEATPAGGWRSRLNLVREIDSSLILDNPPSVPDNAAMLFAEKGLDGEYFQQTDVRPVFFGTDTSLGLKIGWSGAGPFPDSAKLGFNRKELAWVPVSVSEKSLGGKTKHLVKTSSLLATIDSAISQPTLEDGAPKMDIQYVQYFATGEAATLLALQEDVRKAMLVRLDPNQEKFAELAADRFGASGRRTLFAILNNLLKTLGDVAGDANERDLQREALAIQQMLENAEILSKIDYGDFQRYNYKPSTNEIVTVDTKTTPKGFSKAMDYRDDLYEAELQLRNAILDPALKDPNDNTKPITPVGREELDKARLALHDKLRIFEDQLLRDKALLALLQFFFSDS